MNLRGPNNFSARSLALACTSQAAPRRRPHPAPESWLLLSDGATEARGGGEAARHRPPTSSPGRCAAAAPAPTRGSMTAWPGCAAGDPRRGPRRSPTQPRPSVARAYTHAERDGARARGHLQPPCPLLLPCPPHCRRPSNSMPALTLPSMMQSMCSIKWAQGIYCFL